MTNTNSEKFSNIASGIQSVIIAIGLIVGGIWAIYKFEKLDEVERTNIMMGSTIETNIRTHHKYIEADRLYFVFVEIKISNRGKAPVSINFYQAPLRAVRIIDLKTGEKPLYEKDQFVGYEYDIRTQEGKFDSLETKGDKIFIEHGSTKVKNYVFTTSKEGLYLILFKFFRTLPVGLEENIEGTKTDRIVLTEKKFHLIYQD